ncbi:pyridoxal phosphate-dependent aminotransferase [Bacteriovoracaceae bacterium]|nr:pyridoxal phosphate-dependent aminotransferase [Bacteriovoracaceae bacterium]
MTEYQWPIPENILEEAIKICVATPRPLSQCSIREIKKIADFLEEKSQSPFIRMEMGIPGPPPSDFLKNAEKEAIDLNLSGKYPPIEGRSDLKQAASRFFKLFVNIDLEPLNIVPTVGSMNGSYAAFMLAGKRDPKKDTILFLDPGFPVHKQTTQMLGLKQAQFDFQHHRGEKLRDKLEQYLSSGNISLLLYSNPNNPTWSCFTDQELRIIGELANKYDVIVCEDLAYFGMDFREDYSVPGSPPYQPTVAHYADNYLMLISTSKVFSYAGQRTALMAISPTLYDRKFPTLKEPFLHPTFGPALILGCLYGTTSGTSHTSQYALAKTLNAICDGELPLLEDIKHYESMAKSMKKLFCDNGFRIVYDLDGDKLIADGFYFTLEYPNLPGEELITQLLRHGISAISLETTGSSNTSGIRACVSLMKQEYLPLLELRLKAFKKQFGSI